MGLILRDKVVVVTGESREIDRATAETFAAEGARLVLAARSRGPLEDVAKARAARTLVVATDLARNRGAAKNDRSKGRKIRTKGCSRQ